MVFALAGDSTITRLAPPDGALRAALAGARTAAFAAGLPLARAGVAFLAVVLDIVPFPSSNPRVPRAAKTPGPGAAPRAPPSPDAAAPPGCRRRPAPPPAPARRRGAACGRGRRTPRPPRRPARAGS